MKPCPFCGENAPCTDPKCLEASARIPLAPIDSRGISLIRKGYLSQTEAERMRKGMFFRLLPEAQAKLRAIAAERGLPASQLVERWIKLGCPT